MKKLALVTALVLAGISLVVAENILAPTTNGYPAYAQYGGVRIATSAFSTTITAVSGGPSTVQFSTQTADIRGQYVVYGVNFSSGNCGAGDFVDVWDSSTSANAQLLPPTVRFYNVNGSTSVTTNNNSACSGFSGPPLPVRFSKGLFFKPSASTYNSILLLYNKNE